MKINFCKFVLFVFKEIFRIHILVFMLKIVSSFLFTHISYFYGNSTLLKNIYLKFPSVQLLSCVQLFTTPWTAALQTSLSPTPRAYLNSCPSSWWCHPAIILCLPLFFLPSIFPSIRILSNESVLHITIGTSASASVLPMNIQDWFPLG